MLFLFLTLLFISALLSPLLFKISKAYTGVVLSLIPFAFFLWTAFQFPSIETENYITNTYTLVSLLDINLVFRLDSLSFVFLLIITFIGALIIIYSVPYFHKSKELARFFPLLIFFTTAMLGLILTDDLITLFVFWELTSISSFLLIGFEHQEKEAREAAWKALVVTATGGLGLLAGFIILGKISGTFSISEIVNSPETLGDPLVVPAILLIIFGAFTKSAQFPFHSWLPSAMAAPTPVSAYLHSATMVQAGVYLIFRMYPLFHQNATWTWLLLGFGGISMILGGFLAVGQRDLKKILAYATISALGLIIFLVGIGTQKAIEAAILFMVLHAIYKGGLFLVAGIIDKTVHNRSIKDLSGLFRLMPATAVAALLLAASNAGIPPFLGYIGKEVIYESTKEGVLDIFYSIGAVLANVGIVATAFMVGLKPFIGNNQEIKEKPKVAFDFYLPALVLGLLGLIAGIFPQLVSKFLLDPTVHALTGSAPKEHLKLWKGFNVPLVLSIVTIAAGFLAYLFRNFFYKADQLITKTRFLDTYFLYQKSFDSLFAFGKIQTQFFMHGYLRWYLFIAMAFLLAIVTPFLFNISIPIDFHLDQHYYIYAAAIAIVIAAIIAIHSKTFLMSLAALGGVGFTIALIFSLLGAPDLAITQFAVETLTVVLLVLVVYRLPEITMISKTTVKAFDIFLSVLSGALVTILILWINNVPAQAEVSRFFIENSYIKAHGKNIVNVILTDYRALDTLGETIVLATAGLGVYILLNSIKKNKK